MRKFIYILPLLACALCVGCDSATAQQVMIDFDDAEIFIELNDTDGDVGIQVFVDGKPYRKLKVFKPDGTLLLDVVASNSVGLQGISEFFFESGEPSFDVVSLQEFLGRFPQGMYRFEGESIDNEIMNGMAEFTHDLPDGPNITNPEEDDVINPDVDFVITWDAVTNVDIEAYQVIVERDDDGDGEIDLIVSGDVTSFTIPAEFFEAGAEYKVEVLAIEESGNQTITEVPFTTAGP